MRMLLLASTIFGAIIEIIAAIELYNAFGEKKPRKKLYFIILSLAYVVMTIVNTLYINITPLTFLNYAILICLVSFAYRITKVKVMLITIVLSVVLAIIEVLTTTTLSVISNETIANLLSTETTFILIMITSKIITFFVVRLIKHLKNSKEKIYFGYGLALSIFPISSTVILFILSLISYSTEDMIVRFLVLIASALLIIANIALFKIADYILYEIKIRNEKDKRIIAYEQEVKNYSELVNMQRDSAKSAHDIKHKLYAVNDLIKKKDGSGEKAIEEICGMLAENEIKHYTGTKSIDALINAKRKEMHRCGIESEIRVFLSHDIVVSEMDFCVVLGNLIDNALENVKNANEKSIVVTLFERGCYLIVNIKNTTEGLIVAIGETTKKDKLNHGFGLINVKEIVDSYDGAITNSLEDGVYNVSLMMKNIAK